MKEQISRIMTDARNSGWKLGPASTVRLLEIMLHMDARIDALERRLLERQK